MAHEKLVKRKRREKERKRKTMLKRIHKNPVHSHDFTRRFQRADVGSEHRYTH